MPRRRRVLCLPLTLLLASLLLGIWSVVSPRPNFAGAASVRQTGVTARNTIQHIIIMDKENRSFDSMFGRFLGADGATTFVRPDGSVHPLLHQPDLMGDITHGHTPAVVAFDGGKMDGFSKVPGAIQHGKDMADSQFYQSDIPHYWAYAKKFTLDDAFFSTVLGPSFPNHLFSIAAEDGNVDALPEHFPWGCDSATSNRVETRDPDNTVHQIYPCFDFQTLADLLDNAGMGWTYYQPAPKESGYQWAVFQAIKRIREGPDWQTHTASYKAFAGDVANNRLPQVSWLVQPVSVSDHPGISECKSENWTVRQINAVMRNKTLWEHTAIILTWDEYGGLYDHVPPPTGPNPAIEYGFRVPSIVISPYARRGYVDHTMYSFPSMLRFAEETFDLPSLNGTDGQANDMLNSFDFSQRPIVPFALPQRTCPSSSASARLAHVTDGFKD